MKSATEGEVATLRLKPIPNRQGMYKGQYMARRPGEYTIDYPGELTTRAATVLVRDLQLEFRYPQMNEKLLKQAARATGGRLFNYDLDADIVKELGSARKVVEKKIENSLWDTWLSVLLFMLLFGTEWFLRKRWYLD